MEWGWEQTLAVIAILASAVSVLVAVRANRLSEPFFQLSIHPVSRPTLGDTFWITLRLTNIGDRPAPRVRLRFLADPHNTWEIDDALHWHRIMPGEFVTIATTFQHNDSRGATFETPWNRLVKREDRASKAHVSWRSAFGFRYFETLELPRASYVQADPHPDEWPDPSGPAERSHWKYDGT